MAAAKTSGSASSACFLVLDGTDPIPVVDVAGGALIGDVASDSAGAVTHKHVSAARTSDISFSVGVPLPAALQSWLAAILAGSVARRSGAFVLVDHAKRVLERRLFVDALPVELALPVLQAADKSAFRLRLTLSVAALASVKGDNGKLALPVTGKAKAALAGNFRLDLGDLPTRLLAAVETGPLTARPLEKGQSQVQAPDLRLRLGALDIEKWRTFAATFLGQGAVGAGSEREGRLVVLDASLQNEVFALELHGVGLREFAPDWPGQEGVVNRFGATLYVERISFAAAEKQKALGAVASHGAGSSVPPARRAALAAVRSARAIKPARTRSASAG